MGPQLVRTYTVGAAGSLDNASPITDGVAYLWELLKVKVSVAWNQDAYLLARLVAWGDLGDRGIKLKISDFQLCMQLFISSEFR